MSESKPYLWLKTKDIIAAYTFLRIIVGVNYFNHGFVRIGNLPGFIDTMAGVMQDSFIPEGLVRINAALVPPVELIVGFLIMLGLFTRVALIACFCLMAILMYGVTIIQNWDAAGGQLIYNITLFILLAGAGFNTISVDQWLYRRKRLAASQSQNQQRATESILPFWLGKRRPLRSPFSRPQT